jgi:hypothetical protein
MNARSPVDQNELTRNVGCRRSNRARASFTATAFVTSPAEWKTATFGAWAPLPKVFRTRWFA